MAENLHRSACGQYRLNLSNRQAHCLSVAIAAAMGWTSGFNFSAGLVDFVLGWPLATKPYMLIVQGLVFAVIYYFVFDFAIRKFNLMTPGREPRKRPLPMRLRPPAKTSTSPCLPHLRGAGRCFQRQVHRKLHDPPAPGGERHLARRSGCHQEDRRSGRQGARQDQPTGDRRYGCAIRADAMNDIAKGVTVGGDTAPKA